MSSEMIVKEIDGHEYEFFKFGTKKSLKLLMRLSKIVGKPLGMVFGAFKAEPGKKIIDSDLKLDLIGSAIGALTENLDSDEVIAIIEELIGNEALLCNKKKINFNSHFEGNLPHLFKVLGAALEVQYGNFFGVVAGLQEKLR